MSVKFGSPRRSNLHSSCPETLCHVPSPSVQQNNCVPLCDLEVKGAVAVQVVLDEGSLLLTNLDSFATATASEVCTV